MLRLAPRPWLQARLGAVEDDNGAFSLEGAAASGGVGSGEAGTEAAAWDVYEGSGRGEGEAEGGAGEVRVAVGSATAGVAGWVETGGEAGSWGKGPAGSAPGPPNETTSKPKEVTNGLKC